MTTLLDLHDIQGNIVFGYGRFGYPLSRYLFFNFDNGKAARQFLSELLPLVTTSAPLGKQNRGSLPGATTNIAFTYAGLRELDLPDQSMRSFPEDFRMGMKARKDILGDDGASAPDRWDPIWKDTSPVHMLVSINASHREHLEARYKEIVDLLNSPSQGVSLLKGHRGPDGIDNLEYQPGQAIVLDGKTTAKEHFHYTDGISDPVFKGQTKDADQVIGAGKPTGASAATRAGWQELETGEFLLGHRDETQEYPIAPVPPLLSFNGSFMVYRKLHENVGKFNAYLDQESATYGDPEDSSENRRETLKAKFAGRWPNGAPLASYPTYKEAKEFGDQWNAAVNTLFFDRIATAAQKAEAKTVYEKLKIKRRSFDYEKDLDGAACPWGAHTRRTNPRGALQFGTKGAFQTPGALTDRRRILRRGLPYGDSSDRADNDGDHGIIFMAINTSIQRQFEFVQQQWINYGNDFKLSNEKDALLGNHATDDQGKPIGRTVINGDKASGRPPHFCAAMPRFVETRGGDYFFIPSMTALRMIAEGIVDPT